MYTTTAAAENDGDDLTYRRRAADSQLEAICVPMHHAQVWLQTGHVAVHIRNGHSAPHEQATRQVGELARVDLHELVLTRKDFCEHLHRQRRYVNRSHNMQLQHMQQQQQDVSR